MKVNILQESLLQALEAVLPAIKKVSFMPVFETVAITADENGLTQVGTALETTIITTVSATVKEVGGICLPAHTLTEFVKTLPQGAKLSMNLKEGKVRVKGSSQATPTAISIDEFPPMATRKELRCIPSTRKHWLPGSSARRLLLRKATSVTHVRY